MYFLLSYFPHNQFKNQNFPCLSDNTLFYSLLTILGNKWNKHQNLGKLTNSFKNFETPWIKSTEAKFTKVIFCWFSCFAIHQGKYDGLPIVFSTNVVGTQKPCFTYLPTLVKGKSYKTSDFDNILENPRFLHFRWNWSQIKGIVPPD